MKTILINALSQEQAREIVQSDLRPVIEKLIRKAHKEGSRGRVAYAELNLSGRLLNAAISLMDEFEDNVRSLVPGDAWTVSFGYTVKYHAPGFIMIRLK